MSPLIAGLLDISVIIMLVAFMITARQLNGKLKAIRAAQADFDAMVQRFTLASQTAQRAMAEMKDQAVSGQEDLQSKAAEAKALFEELQFMIDAGNNLADRLEKSATSARERATQQPQTAARAAAQAAAPLRQAPAKAAPSGALPAAQAAASVAASASASKAPASVAGQMKTRPQTRAEAELLAALQAAGRAA